MFGNDARAGSIDLALTRTGEPATLCLVAPIRTNEELWARIEALIGGLRLRDEEDLAAEVERALRANAGLTDGWHLMLEGLVAARSSGEARLSSEERTDLDEIIHATRRALTR